MKDETLLRTVKNGLMIAGHEMGPVGDHWPAIHAVVNGVEKEFEDHDRNLAVVGEMEFHIAEALRSLDEAAEKAGPELRAKISAFAQDMWDRYYAIMEPVDAKHKPSVEDLLDGDMSCIKHTNAAIHIIGNLGGRL